MIQPSRQAGEWAYLRESLDAFCPLERDRAKIEQTRDACRLAIERIGLPSGRQHCLAKLERERREWAAGIVVMEHAGPNLAAVVLVRVGRAGEHR